MLNLRLKVPATSYQDFQSQCTVFPSWEAGFKKEPATERTIMEDHDHRLPVTDDDLITDDDSRLPHRPGLAAATMTADDDTRIGSTAALERAVAELVDELLDTLRGMDVGESDALYCARDAIEAKLTEYEAERPSWGPDTDADDHPTPADVFPDPWPPGGTAHLTWRRPTRRASTSGLRLRSYTAPTRARHRRTPTSSSWSFRSRPTARQRPRSHPCAGATPLAWVSRRRTVLRRSAATLRSAGWTSTGIFTTRGGAERRRRRVTRVALTTTMPMPGDVHPGFMSELGRCWRFVYTSQLQATHCSETPTWTGRWFSPRADRWWPVWACPAP
jgi:hypothetical protein